MNIKSNVNYYYLALALRFLLERGKITEEEYGRICRYNAEILRPDSEYI